eukprot:TRINITY_DN1423_c0_g1_i1.p1 TRINITY_DN1423_c0_g1~~TRINITY_DN1423_c0_g1_i1.p1  ORF type:complete len:1291 (+),score=285.26 TRINITY_DN1423_c0_g1_i1:79-3873(+)
MAVRAYPVVRCVAFAALCDDCRARSDYRAGDVASAPLTRHVAPPLPANPAPPPPPPACDDDDAYDTEAVPPPVQPAPVAACGAETVVAAVPIQLPPENAECAYTAGTAPAAPAEGQVVRRPSLPPSPAPPPPAPVDDAYGADGQAVPTPPVSMDDVYGAEPEEEAAQAALAASMDVYSADASMDGTNSDEVTAIEAQPSHSSPLNTWVEEATTKTQISSSQGTCAAGIVVRAAMAVSTTETSVPKPTPAPASPTSPPLPSLDVCTTGAALAAATKAVAATSTSSGAVAGVATTGQANVFTKGGATPEQRMEQFVTGPLAMLLRRAMTMLGMQQTAQEFEKTSASIKQDFGAFLDELTAVERERIKRVTAEENRRQHKVSVIEELVQTEEIYLEDLLLTTGLWQAEMAKASIFTPQETNQIFGNIPQMVPLSQELLAELNKAKANPPEKQLIGHIFLKRIPFFRLYIEYTSGRVVASELLSEKAKKMTAVVEKMREKTPLKGLGLEDYLILPTQRIAKYPLLLRDLLKDTNADHPDYGNLVKAGEEIEKVLLDVNAETKNRQTITLLSKLQPNIIWRGETYNLIQSKSMLVVGGPMKTHVHIGDTCHKGNEAYLFDTCLLVCNYHSAVGKWEELVVMPLADTILESAVDSEVAAAAAAAARIAMTRTAPHGESSNVPNPREAVVGVRSSHSAHNIGTSPSDFSFSIRSTKQCERYVIFHPTEQHVMAHWQFVYNEARRELESKPKKLLTSPAQLSAAVGGPPRQQRTSGLSSKIKRKSMLFAPSPDEPAGSADATSAGSAGAMSVGGQSADTGSTSSSSEVEFVRAGGASLVGGQLSRAVDDSGHKQIDEHPVFLSPEEEQALQLQFQKLSKMVLASGQQQSVDSLIKELSKFFKVTSVNLKGRNGSTMLHSAAYCGNASIIDWLVSRGANVNGVDDQGWTPLMCTVSSGNFVAASLLLCKGATTHNVNVHGLTVLHILAKCRILEGPFLEVLGFLLDDTHSCLDVNARIMDSGETALLMGCSRTPFNAQRAALLEKLLEFGADPNISDKSGTTPLCVATQQSSVVLAKLLLEHGADPAKGPQGKTPIDVARTKNSAELIALYSAMAAASVSDKPTEKIEKETKSAKEASVAGGNSSAPPLPQAIGSPDIPPPTSIGSSRIRKTQSFKNLSTPEQQCESREDSPKSVKSLPKCASLEDSVTTEEVKPEKVKPEKVKPEKVKPGKMKPEKVKPEKVKKVACQNCGRHVRPAGGTCPKCKRPCFVHV